MLIHASQIQVQFSGVVGKDHLSWYETMSMVYKYNKITFSVKYRKIWFEEMTIGKWVYCI